MMTDWIGPGKSTENNECEYFAAESKSKCLHRYAQGKIVAVVDS
jgi:hypothetical protein